MTEIQDESNIVDALQSDGADLVLSPTSRSRRLQLRINNHFRQHSIDTLADCNSPESNDNDDGDGKQDHYDEQDDEDDEHYEYWHSYSDLSQDLLLYIFAFLTSRNVCVVGRVCQNWYRISKEYHAFIELNLVKFKAPDVVRAAQRFDRLRVLILRFLQNMDKDENRAALSSLLDQQKSVQRLRLVNAQKLSSLSLHDIPSLRVLDMRGCAQLTRLEVLDPIPPSSDNNSSSSSSISISSSSNNTVRPAEVEISEHNSMTLIMNGCKAFRDQGLQWTIDHSSPSFINRLNAFELEGAGIRDGALEKIATVQPLARNLSTLVLRWCIEITDEGFRHISTGCPQLKMLDVAFCSITNKTLEIMANGVFASSLEAIDLGQCKGYDDEGLVHMSKGFTNLKRILLCGCSTVTDAGIAPLVSNNHKLEYIDLSYTAVGDHSLHALSASCPRLQLLFLSSLGDSITSEGIKSLAAGNHNLTDLNLSDLPHVGDEGMRSLLTCCRKIKILNLAGCTALTDAAFKLDDYDHDNGDHHHYEHNHVDHEEGVGAQHHHPSVVMLTHLKELNVSRCNLTDESLRSVARRSPNLETLYAIHCRHVANEGFCEIISRCPRLKSLGASNCKLVSDELLSHIAQHSHSLMTLNVGKCLGLTNKGVLSLCEAPSLPLRMLILRGNKEISSATVAKLKQCFSNLEVRC